MEANTTKMNEYERLEQHWRIIGLIHQMIRFSEIKAGMVITLFSVLLTLIFGAEKLIKAKMEESLLFLVLISVFAIIISISFFFSVRAFFPRFMDKNPRSLIYYGDIKEQYKDYHEYSTFLSQACTSGSEMELQIAEQIHTLSFIADSKFKNVRSAVRFLVISLSLLLLVVVVYFMI
jgi:hypothetical protein